MKNLIGVPIRISYPRVCCCVSCSNDNFVTSIDLFLGTFAVNMNFINIGYAETIFFQRDENTHLAKGVVMQVKEYCEAMLAEVNAWKMKLEAMKKVADSYGTEQKEKILPLVGQLEQEVANAQMRVKQLETECPSDWSPNKNELDELFGTIGSKVDRAWRDQIGRAHV